MSIAPNGFVINFPQADIPGTNLARHMEVFPDSYAFGQDEQGLITNPVPFKANR